MQLLSYLISVHELSGIYIALRGILLVGIYLTIAWSIKVAAFFQLTCVVRNVACIQAYLCRAYVSNVKCTYTSVPGHTFEVVS